MVLASGQRLKLRMVVDKSLPYIPKRAPRGCGCPPWASTRGKLVSGPLPTRIYKDKTRNQNFLEGEGRGAPSVPSERPHGAPAEMGQREAASAEPQHLEHRGGGEVATVPAGLPPGDVGDHDLGATLGCHRGRARTCAFSLGQGGIFGGRETRGTRTEEAGGQELQASAKQKCSEQEHGTSQVHTEPPEMP